MVLDPRASLAASSTLLSEKLGRVLVFTAQDVDEADLERLERAGAEVHPVPGSPRGLDLDAVLARCEATGIHSILCEGGGRLASSLIADGIAQRLYLFVAPRVLGVGAVPGFPGPFPADAWNGWQLAFDPERVGADVLLVYDREPRGAGSRGSPSRSRES
jgi:riboflavin biosynthesis pyrimidine reductase